MLTSKRLAAVALAAALGGCATVTRGTTEQIVINSEPAGAEARSSSGHACTATPCTWEVSRKSEFVVSFSKPGYQEMQVPVSTRIAGAGVAGFAGNVVIGGLIGMGVDAATGSTLEHYPSPVMASLIPSKRAAAPVHGKRRRAAKPAAVETAKPEDDTPQS